MPNIFVETVEHTDLETSRIPASFLLTETQSNPHPNAHNDAPCASLPCTCSHSSSPKSQIMRIVWCTCRESARCNLPHGKAKLCPAGAKGKRAKYVHCLILGGKAVHAPLPILELVAQAVMEPGRPPMPELNGPRPDQEASPILRPRDLLCLVRVHLHTRIERIFTSGLLHTHVSCAKG